VSAVSAIGGFSSFGVIVVVWTSLNDFRLSLLELGVVRARYLASI